MVSRYTNSGTIIFSSFSDGSKPIIWKNSSPIVLWAVKFPSIISLHDDGSLQIIHLERQDVHRYRILSSEVAKTFHCLLFNDDHIYLVDSSKILDYFIKKIDHPRAIRFESNFSQEYSQNNSRILGGSQVVVLGGPYQLTIIDLSGEEGHTLKIFF